MLRLRIVVPLSLLSSLACAPAIGEYYTSHCAAAPASPRCEAERAQEFAKARNAEIDASLARVNAAKAWLVVATTHCKTANSTAPRCEAERAHEFAMARNAEIDASLAAVKAERARAFAAARNAEIKASIARVNAERGRQLAQSLTHCKTDTAATPRCREESARQFAMARNAEIIASIAKVAAVRAFEAARNAEIDASLAAVARERAQEFAKARNAEIDASIAAVKSERAREFANARNAEINASIATVQAERALRLALSSRRNNVETGAISLPDTVGIADQAPVVRRTRQARHLGPCREAAHLLNPLQFSEGNAEIEGAMKAELDRVAMMAHDCPAVRFEIHGHSDNSGPAQINRHLAQRRAQSALEYLAEAGIPRNRLVAIGHADAQPVVPNSNDVNRALNRRVELTVNDPAMEAAAQRIIWDLAEVLDPTYVPPLARLSP